MNKPLKAFIVHEFDPCEGSFLVFATSHTEAKKQCYYNWPFIETPEWIDLRARRLPETDNLARGTTPYIEEDFKVLRQAGWHGVFELARCSRCGLASMDMEEYRVCPECGQCKECGHGDKCYTTIIENDGNEITEERILTK